VETLRRISSNAPTMPDIVHHNFALRRIAFGSCHSRGAYEKERRRARASSSSSSSSSSSPSSFFSSSSGAARYADADADDDGPASSSPSSSPARNASSDTIWDVIYETVRPQVFLWTGDAVYSPEEVKGDAAVDVLRNEYRLMHDDEGMGYSRFLRNMAMARRDGGSEGGNGGAIAANAHGTWDDHDYGGNDRGAEMPDRGARRDAYLEFLQVTRESERYHRSGVYSSMDYRHVLGDGIDDGGGGAVRVIFLDTRWHREGHCIPSLASNAHVPYGSLVSCATRWITACLDLPSLTSSYSSYSSWCPEGGGNLLGEDQWAWLEGQLNDSDASMHVIVSSIQVLTTNPVIESWGHFPRERNRLLNLLRDVPGLIVLSGDVHHAEISSTKATASTTTTIDGVQIVEVTSSGLTHSCEGPFYGGLCSPILDAYAAHRASGGNARDVDSAPYYTGRNFGSIDIDWSTGTFRVRVHDASGDVVLSTVRKIGVASTLSEDDVRGVSTCIDGHMLPYIGRVATFLSAVIVVGFSCLLFCQSMSSRRINMNAKKTKRD
jgi:alkaline phosphatase D